MAVAPVFYTITSGYYPGYNLTQRGSQVVIEAADIDSPFQLWYKDDSWRYVRDEAGLPGFALINNGSKAALKADSTAPSKVSLLFPYNRDTDTSLSSVWTLHDGDSETNTTIYSVPLKLLLRLGIGPSPPTLGDGVAAILSATSSTAKTWTLQRFAPKAYRIQTQWYNQYLVAKAPNEDVKFTNGGGSFNNELTVVLVNPSTSNTDGNQEVWYKVPAGSPLEDSNSSFIIISKKNGKALKGSTKAGDKVILKEFDPLDNKFVWTEQRLYTSGQSYLAINLANSDIPLNWTVPNDAEYQNSSWNHPLTLIKATTALDRSQWNFVAYTS